jgi:hypothetical protein
VFVVSDPVDWGRDLQVVPCLWYINVKSWAIFNIPGNDNCMSCKHLVLNMCATWDAYGFSVKVVAVHKL